MPEHGAGERFENVEDRVSQLEKLVYRGNGQEPLTVRMAVLKDNVAKLSEATEQNTTTMSTLLQFQKVQQDRSEQTEKRQKRRDALLMILLTAVLAVVGMLEAGRAMGMHVSLGKATKTTEDAAGGSAYTAWQRSEPK